MISSRLVPVAVFVVLAAAPALGCKTKVDPGAFDAGAAAIPSTEPSTATTAAAADTADAAAEALAPLETGAAKPTAAPTGTAAKPKPSATAAKPADPPECVAARAACSGTGALTLAARKKCNEATAECEAKGGHR